ncbi:uncharacterized protein N7515_007426 [Penicillium bovifimosum]|uniref:Uncharacterized protein n=1 Tax=Penicillium bovifimosum TaxID=126998 RepID=A0A9W9L269_9EURO|nr:uncharacterized protein N7515_007426 [Penicillium bovifimosum]KAJ5131387.1 hypothetical protein N7515_007426 [Penicillium bovifimosum]
MSGFRNTMKGGWHPEGKDGGKESWRGDFKGLNQVAGWMGKGKDGDSERSGSGSGAGSGSGSGSGSGLSSKFGFGSGSGSGQSSQSQGGIRNQVKGQVAGFLGKGNNTEVDRSDHVSQPLSSLKDPLSFGPPPKHSHYHGAAAVPNRTTPDHGGLGAPLTQDQINAQHRHEQEAAQAEEEELQKRAAPPVPYRADTTGLSTNNLPPPPRRVDSTSPASTASISKSNPPKPPPRLPARNSPSSLEPPPVYSATPVISDDYINQDATSRLANAGVSVPGFGIGQEKAPSPGNTPVNELQSRFYQMNTSGPPTAPAPPARASTNIEAQSPSSTSSIQNFRERHGDKIDSGKQKYADFRERHADSIDSGKQKYGDFRERHADSIDAGKQKLSGVTSRFTGSSPAPPPPARASTIQAPEHTRSTSSVQDFRDRHADKIDAGKQKYGDFRERHADSIDAGKQKLSGVASRFTGSSPAPPPARPASNTSSMNLEPAEPARGTSSVQDFRERHSDKIEMGKEKWGGVSSRFSTFVEDRKFSADANKRIPRPPSRPVSMAQSNSPALSPAEPDLQTQAQRKKAPPPPPPKRAEFRAPAVGASPSSSPAPPPIPLGTKPR